MCSTHKKGTCKHFEGVLCLVQATQAPLAARHAQPQAQRKVGQRLMPCQPARAPRLISQLCAVKHDALEGTFQPLPLCSMIESRMLQVQLPDSQEAVCSIRACWARSPCIGLQPCFATPQMLGPARATQSMQSTLEID